MLGLWGNIRLQVKDLGLEAKSGRNYLETDEHKRKRVDSIISELVLSARKKISDSKFMKFKLMSLPTASKDLSPPFSPAIFFECIFPPYLTVLLVKPLPFPPPERNKD